MDAGSAVGANPIAIGAPRHRVLGKGGDLKGYAWGLRRKRWLLEHEKTIELHDALTQWPNSRAMPPRKCASIACRAATASCCSMACSTAACS
jgi:hypothetical protein